METAKTRKYGIPEFLEERISQTSYDKWLSRKAATHLRRDRLRRNSSATKEIYKRAIHDAVCNCGGRDTYTGEMLNWELLGTYNNDESRLQRRGYKHKLGLLPTVDHVGDGTGEADFRICGWRTNDAKGDLPYEEFVELCRSVLLLAGYQVSKTS